MSALLEFEEELEVRRSLKRPSGKQSLNEEGHDAKGNDNFHDDLHKSCCTDLTHALYQDLLIISEKPFLFFFITFHPLQLSIEALF